MRGAPLVFGIHRDLFGRHSSESADDCRRAAGSIFIKVEPHLSFAALGGSLVRPAFENGLAHGKTSGHGGNVSTGAVRIGEELRGAKAPPLSKMRKEIVQGFCQRRMSEGGLAQRGE